MKTKSIYSSTVITVCVTPPVSDMVTSSTKTANSPVAAAIRTRAARN